MEMGVLSVAERAAFLPSRAFPHAALSFPLPFLVLPSPPRCRRGITFTCRARRKNSYSEPALKREPIEVAGEAEGYEEEVEEEDTDFDVEMFDDEMPEEDDENFEDDLEAEDVEPYIGDGGSGGGVNLSGTTWDKEALAIAEGVSLSFDGDLKIYAFKTSARPSIQVRIEKLSNKSGSPGMSDIEAFTSVYQARLDEAAVAGCIPDNLFLEVSSPGVERVVRIPDDLERFKDRPMYVKYTSTSAATPESTQECEGIFRLVSFDLELARCIWGVADVRINREKAGKGRPLSKKQREWRVQTPFKSLRIVRIYSEC